MADSSGRPLDGGATVELVLKGLDHSTQTPELDAAAKDWWPIAGKWTDEEAKSHRPGVVVRVKSEEDVMQVLREADAKGISVVPRGAGSGVVGGVVGNGRHLSLDLSSMNRVLEVDPERCEVVVEPGKLAGELEEELNRSGLTLGHYPQSLHLASIGGLVATRSSGTFSNKYGGIEDLVVGLRVVMPDGSLSDFRSVPRSATGPHLMPIFVGSEGTLGVITRITLRVFQQAEARVFGGYTFPSFADAVRAVKQCYSRHVIPAVLRIYDETEASNLYKRVGDDPGLPLLIVGHDGARSIVDAESMLIGEIAEAFGGKWIGNEIGDAWEAHRFHAQWLIDGNDGPGKMADAIEIAASWPDVMPIFEEVKSVVSQHCTVLMAHMSHFYSTGGAIYFIFTIEDASPESARKRYLEVWKEVMRITLEKGGSISHHHGIGSARSAFLPEELGSVHKLLQAIKNALDPNGMLNPGKLGLPANASLRDRG